MRLVCPLIFFFTIYTTLPCNLIKVKLLDLIEHAFQKIKVHFILPATIRNRFSLLQTIEDINFGVVRMYVTPYRISWIIFTSDLVKMYTDKLLVFRWVLIVHL